MDQTSSQRNTGGHFRPVHIEIRDHCETEVPHRHAATLIPAEVGIPSASSSGAATEVTEEQMAERHVDMDGRTYVWTGRDWYDKATNMKPPRSVLHQLESWLAEQPVGVDEKLDLAKRARAAEISC